MIKLFDILSEGDSSAPDEAKKRGLTYKGFGYWQDRTGKTVAFTNDDGRLQDVPDDASDEVDADEFAQSSHGDQQYGNKPYKYHLDKVVDNAKRFGGTRIQILAARLHDTIEDTAVTHDQLVHRFGKDVADIVDLVSNQSKDQPNWKRATLERIRSNPNAVFVKLCDRIANTAEGGKIDKYRKEYPLFKEILYRPGEYDLMWKVLDKLHGVD